MPSDVLSRNNVQVRGRGSQPVVFAHGFGCDQNMWRHVAPAFEDEYRVVLFDHVGSGRSDPSAYDAQRYSALNSYAADLVELCDAVKLRDVVFIGHSVSCMIGLLASIQRPELFARMVLIGPSPCYVNDPPDDIGGFERSDVEDLLQLMEKNYVGWASFFAPTVMQNAEKPELAEELEGSFCSTNPKTALQFARTTFFGDNRADLAKVTVPSVILQCAEDVIAPTAVGEYVHRNLPGSELRMLQATGHCPHLSHPRETLAVIREYLNSPVFAAAH